MSGRRIRFRPQPPSGPGQPARAGVAGSAGRASPRGLSRGGPTVWANAAGEENSRFFSSSVTRSAARRARVAPGRFRRSCGELGQQPVRLSLARLGSRTSGLRSFLAREPRRAVRTRGAVALEPADHDPRPAAPASGSTPRANRWLSSSLQQRGERLRVAVVRRRGQEQPVLEVRGEPPDQPASAERVDRVPLPSARRGARGAPRPGSAGRTSAGTSELGRQDLVAAAASGARASSQSMLTISQREVR